MENGRTVIFNILCLKAWPFPGKQLTRLKIPPVHQKTCSQKKLLLVKMRPKMKDNIVKIGLGVIDAPYSNLAVSTSTTMSTWCSTPPRWPRPLTCATRVSGRLERIVNV